MELTEGKIVLRRPILADAPAVCDACQDPEIPRWLSIVPQPYTEQTAVEYVVWSDGRWQKGSFEFVVVDSHDGALLGAIGMGVNERWKIGHIGYWVAAPARRRGVASGALRLLASWGLEQGFGRLELVTDPDNHASQAVAEKVGFRREAVLRSHVLHRDGRRRDSVLFSLLPGELS